MSVLGQQPTNCQDGELSALGQEQTSLCDLQELFGIVREYGASTILRYLHSIDGALCFGDAGLAITYAELRIRSEKNALGTEEIKR